MFTFERSGGFSASGQAVSFMTGLAALGGAVMAPAPGGQCSHVQMIGADTGTTAISTVTP